MHDMAFGGGSEMLRDGDSTGQWAMLQAGMKYSCPFPVAYQSVAKRFRSIFTLVGHLPWLARFMMLIPGISNNLDSMRKAGFEKAVARKKEGSKQKDLFYYLVSITRFFYFPYQVQTRLRRLRSPTSSVRRKKRYR